MEDIIDASEASLFVGDRTALTVSAGLLVAAVASWGALYYLMPLMTSTSSMLGVASMVSSVSPVSIGIFELVWLVGMIAMMFPAMIPVVTFYNKLATRAEANPAVARTIGTPLFLVGYLGTYAGLGLAAYLAVYVAVGSASFVPFISSVAFIGPSLVLVLAGVYQLSPMKLRALSFCISPMAFFAVHARKGLLGSLRMGAVHGKYCVGCCWAYMLVMLAVAAMSLPIMIILAGLIAVEKVIAKGAVWFNRGVAGILMILGVLVFFVPSVLMVV